MSTDTRGQVGLSRRELEREMQWLMNRLPPDPQGMIRHLSEAIVTLIDKNNAAIARSLAEREAREGGGGF